MRQRPITTPTSRINRSVLRVYFFSGHIDWSGHLHRDFNECMQQRTQNSSDFPSYSLYLWLGVSTYQNSHAVSLRLGTFPSGILYTLQHKRKHTNEERRRRVLLVALERFAELARRHPP